MLTPVQELTDRENQQGVTGVRLSPNRRFAVSSAFRSQTISLFRRLHQDGTLERVSLARDGDEYVTLRWPVDVAFSPDSSFLYVADAGGSSSSPGPGSVVTLCITAGGKLIGVDSNDGDGECFGNVRGIAVHPDGKTIVVAAAKSGTVVVLDCDQKTGKTSVRQIIKDGENDVLAIGGAMGVGSEWGRPVCRMFRLVDSAVTTRSAHSSSTKTDDCRSSRR